MRETVVADGALGPRTDLGSLRTAEEINQYLGQEKEGEVVFVSNSRNLMVLLRKDLKKMVGDVVVEEPHRIAQFEGGVYRTSDEWEIERLLAAKGFGPPGSLFWRADEARALAEDAQYNAFMSQLERNPSLKKKVRLAVGMLPDFAPTGPPQKTITPTPPG